MPPSSWLRALRTVPLLQTGPGQSASASAPGHHDPQPEAGAPGGSPAGLHLQAAAGAGHPGGLPEGEEDRVVPGGRRELSQLCHPAEEAGPAAEGYTR